MILRVPPQDVIHAIIFLASKAQGRTHDEEEKERRGFFDIDVCNTIYVRPGNQPCFIWNLVLRGMQTPVFF
jgi:hypothetical protein